MKFTALALCLVATPALAQSMDCHSTGTSDNGVHCQMTPAPGPSGAGIVLNGLANIIRARRDAEYAAQAQVQYQAAAQAQAQAQVQSAINSFAGDPSHPYFGIVRDRMAELLSAGQAPDLQTAYDIAVRTSPDVAALEALHHQ